MCDAREIVAVWPCAGLMALVPVAEWAEAAPVPAIETEATRSPVARTRLRVRVRRLFAWARPVPADAP
ncbi:hypothetical protein [Sphingomonas psychrotolerans]|uniref:hypothetical protein n=1 Tax=Sphingomonas psychrotolerans TaxID=1327635 RepID=UPI0013053B17|nr:hypothetical protein [Sphingomonas psychrotolerans]